jgi:hypothetical protein
MNPADHPGNCAVVIAVNMVRTRASRKVVERGVEEQIAEGQKA